MLDSLRFMGSHHRYAAVLQRLSWTLAVALVAAVPAQTSAQTMDDEGSQGGSGSKGAQIYCFMRNNGNDHQVSWDASYAVIKRQSDQLFKTSPEHAAVMITESVVQNPNSYPDCGSYLGDLFRKPEPSVKAPTTMQGTTRNDLLGGA